MNSPGTLLREAREARGLTLADVAAVTRIPKTMLAHLENDRYEEYAAEVFARGHLMNFAREVGLDPREVLKAYRSYTGAVSEEDSESKKSEGRRSRRSRTRSVTSRLPTGGLSKLRSTVRPTHMVAVVIVLFGLFMLISFLSGNRATANDPASYPETRQQDWELEEDAREARWLLEQPSEDNDARRSDPSQSATGSIGSH